MKVGLREKVKDGETKPTRFYSSKQEKEVAKELGGTPTPNSGATPFIKGDLTLKKFLIECKTKTSDSESISIKKEWLEKLNQEALFMGKPYKALIFSFGPASKTYVIIDENTFKELISNETE